MIMPSQHVTGPADHPHAEQASAVDDQAAPAPRRYEPPRLTGKQALAQVTLFSFSCTPGDPACHVGHP